LICYDSEYISREAEGSGIPELKAIMSGLNIFKYFSFQTYIGKAIGIIAGMSAGLSVGREGPYVHMSSCIATKLSKLSWFRDMDQNSSLRK
jgi:chloride channel 2